MAAPIQASIPAGLTVEPRVGSNVSFAIHKSSKAEFDIDPAERERRWIEMLSRALTRGNVVAFLGSGCGKAFGLPDWRALAIKIAEQAGKGKALPDNPNAADIPSLIGHYRRVIADESKYKKIIEQALEPKELVGRNPYVALLQLSKIHRFVTSNYDDLLEEALSQGAFRQGENKREFDKDEDSFGPDCVARLAEFVMTDPASHRDMVFHCHGRLKDHVDSLIVTEEDYQERYFGQGEERVAFRQALELLYGSNPILFIGTSLDDEDLFRPLRAFGAIHRMRRREQLLFALVPEEDERRIESLHTRYGVKVITYALKDPRSGDNLSRALEQIHEHWTNHRESWLRKPTRRMIPKIAGNIDRRPGQEVRTSGHVRLEQNIDPRVRQSPDSDVDQVTRLLAEPKQVVCLLGAGGVGKSWLANKILDRRKETAGPNNKLFFWSSYYSGDYLSGLDRALAFLEGDQLPALRSGTGQAFQESSKGEPQRDIRSAVEQESRLERLLLCLRQGAHTLVFDGVERVLRESSKKPETGIPLNPDITRFLRVICSQHTSKIILTSRLWPETFDDATLCQAVVGYRLSGATSAEVLYGNWLDCIRALGAPDCTAIVKLLGGHRYALTLAEAWLSIRQDQGLPTIKAAKHLQLLLAGAAPEHRVSRMIELVVRDLQPLEQKLLDYLSVCMGTIPQEIEDKCKELAKRDWELVNGPASTTVAGSNEDPAKKLRKCSLLFQMEEAPNRIVSCIHPIVRGYVFHRRHHAISDELPNFTLPGFTAGGSQVDPGGLESANEILGILNEFYAEGWKRRSEALAFCRNAFGIVRSRMDANTSARWDHDYSAGLQDCPGERHLRAVIQLGDFVREVSFGQLAPSAGCDPSVDAPLWDDELAWLYNEIGLAYYHKGAALDALSVWELEHEINGEIDSSSTGGLYLFQSSCNLGAAFIQLGRLQQAEIHLRDAERINSRMNDVDHGARIFGYRALIEHLRGNLRAAEVLYTDAITKLEGIGFNQRGLSIFERHYADLLMKMKKNPEAEHYIMSGRARAEAAQYPDIVASYRISAGHLHRSQGKIDAAMSRYASALEEAREMGLRGLEADALSELSRLALDVGDTQTAIDRAVEALLIANELCLGIRQSHGLVVLGRALIRSKRVAFGAAYLRQARRRAEMQGYWLRAREADEELRELGSEFNRPSSPRAF
jgi:tetratricopeptide (TPR) repeat protein